MNNNELQSSASKSYDNLNELYHFGRLGMHWGKRNGPPYPLDYSQLSKEERYEAKSKAKRSGNIKEASDNREYFNDRELQEVIDRYRLNQTLDRITAEEIESGAKKVKKMTDTFGTVGNLLGAVGKAAGNGIKLYNNLDAIYSYAMGEKPHPISTPGGGKNKNRNKDKNNQNRNNNQQNRNNNRNRSQGSFDEKYKKGSISGYASYNNSNPYGGKKKNKKR